MRRRNFIKSVLSFSAVPYMRTFASQAKPYLRMGVLSDTHVRKPGWTLDPFIGALKWFDSQKVDGVIIAGDIVDQGLTEQLRHVGA
ncbi:MAG: metallophosphoesterase, partial [Kiritimatiellae bacterium]|nr:metallophosphoesterase [Kiritimatiellia bacterium]